MERIWKRERTDGHVSHVLGAVSDQRAFSLMEVQVSLIVAAILILTIGVISQIAQESYTKVLRKEAIFNNVAYSFKLMRNKIRSSESVEVKTNPPNPPWQSSQLLFKYPQRVGGVETLIEGAFGLYKESGASSVDLVYVPNTAQSEKEVLLSFPDDQTIYLTFPEIAAQGVAVRLSRAENERIPFDVTQVIFRRTP